jgi:hypothetical protein
MKINCTLFILFLTLYTNLTAQVEKVYYQSMIVSDSTMQLEFDIDDPHEVIPWNHEGRVMIEVSTRLDGANMDILSYIIKQGRYAVALDEKYPVTTMRYVNKIRPAIKHKGEMCQETVTMKIYIPIGFTTRKPVEVENPSLTTLPKGNVKN